MTAWEILTDSSTAPVGSIAWVHLNSQSGGSGVINIYGENQVVVDPQLVAMIEKTQDYTAVIVNEYSCILDDNVMITFQESDVQCTLEADNTVTICNGN